MAHKRTKAKKRKDELYDAAYMLYNWAIIDINEYQRILKKVYTTNIDD